MEGYRNLCAQVPLELHARVREEQEKAGQSLSEYVTKVLTEYYEKGGCNMSEKMRTLAFQVSTELFQRVKANLAAHPGVSQKDFVVGLIEQALTEWEAAQDLTQPDGPDAPDEAAGNEQEAGEDAWESR